MTKGFVVITSYPYEGVAIVEYDTKATALAAYKEAVLQVDKEYVSGAALAHREVIEEKGDWK